MTRTTRRGAVAAVAALGLFGINRNAVRGFTAVCAPALPESASARVTYTPIAEGLPLNAPAQTMRLYRFTMPPGEMLPAHSHPGATLLQIESGELSYTVVRGQVRHWTRDVDGKRTERLVTAGATVVFGPGDAIFYDVDTAHSAVNPGEVPVAVLAVTLLDTSLPQTIPVGAG
jgi:mannose-6-phosphate isomerase-like protein (cupin superfamily)